RPRRRSVAARSPAAGSSFLPAGAVRGRSAAKTRGDGGRFGPRRPGSGAVADRQLLVLRKSGAVLVDDGLERGDALAVVAGGQPELVDDDEFEGQQAGAADGDDGDDGAGDGGGHDGGDDEDAHLELDAAD